MKSIGIVTLFILLITASLSFLFCDAKIFAQTSVASQTSVDENTLNMIMITATRMAEEIMEIPASATVITGEEINNNNYTTMYDAFKKQAGFYYDDGWESLQLRGQSTDDVQVLVNGVPSFSPFDNDANIESISLFDVERIEVLRGSSSTLYGANAVAGVINITKKEPEKNEFRAKFGYGTYDTWYKGVDVYLVGEKIGIGFGWESKKTKGWRGRYARYAYSSSSISTSKSGPLSTGYVAAPADARGNLQYFVGERGERGNEKENMWFNIKYDVSENFKVKYNMTYYLYEGFTKNPSTYMRDANGNPVFIGHALLPNGLYLNFNESAYTDYINRKEVMTHSLQFIDDFYKYKLVLGFSKVMDDGYNSGSTFGPGSGTKAEYPGSTYNVDFQKEWNKFGRHHLLTGFTLRQDQMTYDNIRLTDWHDSDSGNRLNYSASGKDQMGAIFIQDSLDITDTLKFIAGLRFDYYTNKDGKADLLTTTPKAFLTFPSKSYSEFSPKLALQYRPTDDISVYGSFGHAFRPPNLYQLYRVGSYSSSSGYRYVGNPNLKPETSDTYEIGLKSTYFDTNFELAIFQTKTKGAIVTIDYNPGTFPIFVNPNETIRAYTNVDKETRRGVEVSLSRDFGKYFDVFVNYTWQEGKYDGGKTTAGTPISSIPKNMFNIGLDFSYKTFDIEVLGRFSSSRSPVGVPDGIYYNSYDEFFYTDVNANFRFLDNYKITASVTNLFDKFHYQEYIAPGRRIMVTLSVEY